SNGKVITDFGWAGDVGSAIVILSNGKIVVAGGAGESSNFDFALARYNPDGTLDTTFGIGGTVTTNFGTSVRANILAIQPDGKIVVVGTAGEYYCRDFALARYTAEGSLDTTFGNDGRIVTDFFGDADRAFAVAVQPDGRIVVAGTAGTYPREDF